MAEVVRTPRAKKTAPTFEELQSMVDACGGGRLGDDLFYELQRGITGGTQYPLLLWEAWKKERNLRRQEMTPEAAAHAKRKKQRQRMKKEHLATMAPKLLKELKHLVLLMEPVEAGQLNIPGLATLNGARAVIAETECTEYLKSEGD